MNKLSKELVRLRDDAEQALDVAAKVFDDLSDGLKQAFKRGQTSADERPEKWHETKQGKVYWAWLDRLHVLGERTAAVGDELNSGMSEARDILDEFDEAECGP